ncbi:MAG: hypothetical protein WDO15_21785 [Bacteroidota bacterium]
MEKLAAVKSVSVTSRVPGEWKEIRTIKLRMDGSTNEPMIFYMFGADKEFMKTYEIELLQGRNFENDNDSTSVILNETAARMLGITEPSRQQIEISARSSGSGFRSVFPRQRHSIQAPGDRHRERFSFSVVTRQDPTAGSHAS